MNQNSIPKPPVSALDDPDRAAYAWARYRRLMWWMALFSLTCVVVAFAFLYAQFGPLSIHLYLATAAGIAVSVMLAAALMGLVFLSNGTGHDEAIVDPTSDPDDFDDNARNG